MVMLIRMAGLLIASSLIVGCSFLSTHNTQQSSNDSQNLPPRDTHSQTTPPLTSVKSDIPSSQLTEALADTSLETIPEEYAAFEASTLYSLLAAEIAGQRQQFAISLANYLDQARKTKDPAIAERATRIAQYLGSKKYILESSEVWVQNAPQEPLAHQSRAHALIMAGNFHAALTHMKAEFEFTGESQFDYLAISSQSLDRVDKLDLLNRLEDFTDEHSDYAQLWMAQGSLLMQLEDYPSALMAFDSALELRQDYTAAALSKARILHNIGQVEDALELLNRLHSDLPSHKGIGVLRARVMIDLKRFNEARKAFQKLSQRFSSDDSIKLSLALLHMELKEFDESIAILSALSLNNAISNDAYFYLARIAELQKDYPRALKNYNQVQPGNQLLSALVKASNLLLRLEGINAARDYISQKRGEFPSYNIELTQLEIELLSKEEDYAAAYKVADETLSEHPQNTQLLYSRGLLAERMGDLDQLETDLRHIIRLNPSDAEAMNALGYTLANKTDQLEEALSLIQRALALSPGNPAIIDSLGWAYYRLGDLEKALEYLQQAFAAFPDHEVAAHLGEVLWQLNQTENATQIWQQGLEQKPDSSIIKETLERLDIEGFTD